MRSWYVSISLVFSTRPRAPVLDARSRVAQKNVYSVFRYNPASIGFAALSETAIAQNGVSGAVPSATIGTAAASITNTSAATPRFRRGVLGAVGVLLSVALLVL